MNVLPESNFSLSMSSSLVWSLIYCNWTQLFNFFNKNACFTTKLVNFTRLLLYLSTWPLNHSFLDASLFFIFPFFFHFKWARNLVLRRLFSISFQSTIPNQLVQVVKCWDTLKDLLTQASFLNTFSHRHITLKFLFG